MSAILNIREGIRLQAEERKKQLGTKQEEKVVNLTDNEGKMTTEQQLELLVKAVADLTLKVNGGNK
ncbi:hypothetical protein RAH41_14140 [Gottfriedia acidiceleris]|uniref:hypothetical protein n=1 Tax=Gottfriedia acidiceleris TaxID=371036 RepID=UPI002F269EE1